MLPSILFGIVYLFCLKDPYLHTFYDNLKNVVLDGVGHMWFLPMLFFCFIYTWFSHKIFTKSYVPLILIFLSNIVFITGLYGLMCLCRYNCYYMLFFYLGFYIRLKNIDVVRFAKFRNIIILVVLSAIGFLTAYLTEFGAILAGNKSFDATVFTVYINGMYIKKLLYSLPGTLAIYLISVRLIYVNHVTVSSRFTKLAGYCFGVYLFQEFILKGLYFHTPLPSLVGAYALPWVGIAITLPLSLLGTWLMLKTRPGRWLIG